MGGILSNLQLEQSQARMFTAFLVLPQSLQAEPVPEAAAGVCPPSEQKKTPLLSVVPASPICSITAGSGHQSLPSS